MSRSSQSGGGKTGSDDLARVIRARRRELGMSRQDLADAAGIPYPTVAQIETAYRGVSPGRLGIIARTLGLDPKELYDLLAAGSAPPSPVGQAAGRDVRSSHQRIGSWYANPSYPAADAGAPPAAAAAADTEPPNAPGIVDEVVGLLSQLPPNERIEALGEVQTRLLAGIVEERIRRSAADD